MPKIALNEVELHYEETGSGFPMVFCHEFAGDHRSWEPQVRYFSRRYRVITYNFRGYAPSSVPDDPAAYSQDLLVADLRALLAKLSIDKAHIVGIATGANVALNFAIAHPGSTRSAIIVGGGAGTVDRENWLKGAQQMADGIARIGADAIVQSVSSAPQRQALRIKDPKSWRQFLSIIGELSPKGAELSMRGVLMKRKPVTDLEAGIRSLTMPLLVMVGDQDTPAFEPSLFIHRHAVHAGLSVFPVTGHTLPIEEPDHFNRVASEFLAAVDSGRWGAWRADG